MSVVAGAAQLDYVILTADSRVSWTTGATITRTADFGLKVLPLTPLIAMGFVANDVRLTGRIIRNVLDGLPTRRRLDPYSLYRWLPRFCKFRYAALRSRIPLAFVVASVLPRRPTPVPRRTLLDLLDKIVQHAALQRNYLPDFLVRSLMTPAELDPVEIRARACPLLYTLEAPEFRPVIAPPLSHVVIGSGRDAAVEVNRYSDAVAGFSDQPFLAAVSLCEAIRRYIGATGHLDVGGSFPALLVHASGIAPVELRAEIAGRRIDLSCVGGTWTQRNFDSGKVFPLLEPWNLPTQTPAQDQRFDDWQNAWNDFLGVR